MTELHKRPHPHSRIGHPGLAVVATGLRKEYELGESRITALGGVDLAVHQGEFLCVMGPSGSGKSTLLHILAGLLPPTAGSVRIGETEIHALSDTEASRFRRRRLGLVFQFFNLVPTLDVEENVALPLLLENRRLATVRDRVRDLLELMGLGPRRNAPVSLLSGGEMQRVAIARALLVEPELLLADEPTGNLDSKSGEEILSLMRTASDEKGVTTILVTHDLRGASYADRVVVLRDGIVTDDVPANLLGRAP